MKLFYVHSKCMNRKNWKEIDAYFSYLQEVNTMSGHLSGESGKKDTAKTIHEHFLIYGLRSSASVSQTLLMAKHPTWIST